MEPGASNTWEPPPSPLDRLVRIALRLAYRGMRLWWRLSRPTIHGALVAVWIDDALLLISNSYRGGETLPGGGVRGGETPREAARRELGEEVGIEVEESDLRFAAELDVWTEGKRDVATYFELRLDRVPEVRVDRREVTAAALVPREDLLSRRLRNPVRAYLAALREPLRTK